MLRVVLFGVILFNGALGMCVRETTLLSAQLELSEIISSGWWNQNCIHPI